MKNKEDYLKTLFSMSIDSLRSLARDTRAQAQIGLLSSKEAHDRINSISAVILSKEVGLDDSRGEYAHS
jgi:hypothetical protein